MRFAPLPAHRRLAGCAEPLAGGPTPRLSPFPAAVPFATRRRRRGQGAGPPRSPRGSGRPSPSRVAGSVGPTLGSPSHPFRPQKDGALVGHGARSHLSSDPHRIAADATRGDGLPGRSGRLSTALPRGDRDPARIPKCLPVLPSSPPEPRHDPDGATSRSGIRRAAIFSPIRGTSSLGLYSSMRRTASTAAPPGSTHLTPPGVSVGSFDHGSTAPWPHSVGTRPRGRIRAPRL